MKGEFWRECDFIYSLLLLDGLAGHWLRCDEQLLMHHLLYKFIYVYKQIYLYLLREKDKSYNYMCVCVVCVYESWLHIYIYEVITLILFLFSTLVNTFFFFYLNPQGSFFFLFVWFGFCFYSLPCSPGNGWSERMTVWCSATCWVKPQHELFFPPLPKSQT